MTETDRKITDPDLKKSLLMPLIWLGAAVIVFLLCSLWGVHNSWTLWLARAGRLAAVAIVGMSLASGGMSLQGLLRNPLAEPYLLGISSGAGVGVILGIWAVGESVSKVWMTTPLLAFVGAMSTCFIVYLLASRAGMLDPYTLILAGVIVNAFNGAIMLSVYMFMDPYRIPDFARWNMGQVPETISGWAVFVCGLLAFLGWFTLWRRCDSLNALSLGDDVAASMGVTLRRLRTEVFVIVSLMTALSVALVGPIGFVGLIIPHICRMMTGVDQRKLIIVSGFVGAIFLMAAETLCRNVGVSVGVGKIPLGIICAFCGCPFFIHLLRKDSTRLLK